MTKMTLYFVQAYYQLIYSILFAQQRLLKGILVLFYNKFQFFFQVVKMLACVVLIFATLWLPYRGMLVYNSLRTIYEKEPFMDLWYLMFAKSCIYMNW